jgi:hypothetical protein
MSALVLESWSAVFQGRPDAETGLSRPALAMLFQGGGWSRFFYSQHVNGTSSMDKGQLAPDGRWCLHRVTLYHVPTSCRKIQLQGYCEVEDECSEQF